MNARILFVDDEPGIRSTLPEILKRHGFEVAVASSVPEALAAINSAQFDVLISDLNIGEPGDGFTVVSAMRRTQPNCRNMILTGYPGFESALQAIRNQVDEYLMKPAEIRKLIQCIEQRVQHPAPHSHVSIKPLAEILRENREEIIRRTLQDMLAHAEIRGLALSETDRIDHLPRLLEDLALQMEVTSNGAVSEQGLEAAVEHGRTRFRQGYSLGNLVDDTRALEKAIYDVVQANLLAVDLSNLLPDLRRINDGLDIRLKESLRGFQQLEEQAA